MNESDRHDEQISKIYRQATGDEPPPQLDSRILAASKRHTGTVSPSPGGAASYWRWPAALASLAAVVVLSLLLIPQMQELEHEREQGLSEALKPGPEVGETAKQSPFAERIEKRTLAPVQTPPASAPAVSRSRPQTVPESDTAMGQAVDSSRPVEDRPPPADRWMEAIMQLAASGRNLRASEELRQFRRVYPDYVIDASLLRALQEQAGATPGQPGTVE